MAKASREGTRIHCWLDCKLFQALCKSLWIISPKLKIPLPSEPATLPHGPQDSRYLSSHVYWPLFPLARKLEHLNVFRWWMDNKNVEHKHYGVLFICKEKLNHDLFWWTAGTWKGYTEWVNPHAERQMSPVLSLLWFLSISRWECLTWSSHRNKESNKEWG